MRRNMLLLLPAALCLIGCDMMGNERHCIGGPDNECYGPDIKYVIEGTVTRNGQPFSDAHVYGLVEPYGWVEFWRFGSDSTDTKGHYRLEFTTKTCRIHMVVHTESEYFKAPEKVPCRSGLQVINLDL